MPEFSAKPEKMIIGGQAVIEGVMMRSKRYLVVAVRAPNKKVKYKIEKLQDTSSGFLQKPFVRGVYTMFQSMILGIQALTFSANASAGEKEEHLSSLEIAVTLSVALLFSIGIFLVLPFFLSKLVTTDNLLFNIIDGMLRMAFFFLYILIISRMQDIQRVFQYHGAEHKTVHAYESGKKLTAANAKKFSTLHPRCGTTFMLFVVLVSIVVFSMILTDKWYFQLGARIVLLPVIAGVSYEILRVSAKYYKNAACKILVYPGLMLQKLTTREPSHDQLEIAVLSLKKVLALEKRQN